MQEERKKQIQQKKADTQSRNKRIEELLQKYREELPPGAQWSEAESIRQKERAYAEYETERVKEQMRIALAEDQRLMQESEKRKREQREQQRKNRKTPQHHFQMLLSKAHEYRYRDPALTYLVKEVMDMQTFNGLMEITKTGESPKAAINRVLNAIKNGLTIY